MPTFKYRALKQSGEIVSGSISAPTAAEVTRQLEYLGLLLIDMAAEQSVATFSRLNFSLFSRPRPEDVTAFLQDIALLLKAGARLDAALELLAADFEVDRLRSTIAKIRTAILGGESFAEALSAYPDLFPAMYVALVRVGESTGTLDQILEVLAEERTRSEILRRKVVEALQYPAFVLLGSVCVLFFFLLFVLPQFASVLRDFGVKLDPIVATMLGVSETLQAHALGFALACVLIVVGGLLVFKRPYARAKFAAGLRRLPVVSTVTSFHRTALFCRNLAVLLKGGVPLTNALRILADMVADAATLPLWTRVVDSVRRGEKLTDALADTAMLPSMAVRMLRLGEETGQLPMLAGRVAVFYEAKLQRKLDRIVGIAGPAAIIAISVVVGGLIISVMTALLSVSQIVG